MKALLLSAKGKLSLQEIATPWPKEGEALLKVRACGICGSDLPRIFGDIAYFYPLIPGHEFAGEVVEVGSFQDQAWIGKRVTVYPLIPCRTCPYCEAGWYELCENYDYLGSRRNGAFAEYVVVPVENLMPLPAEVSFLEGAMTEPAAVTFHALRRLGSCLGESVMVFGLGPIGLLVGVWARLAGARWLWGVEVDKKRVSLARNVGFDEVFHPWAIDAGKTPQVVVEASGNEKALLNSLSVVAKRGRLLLLGNQEKEVTLAPKDWSFILRKELTILGSWNSSFAHIFGDWEKVLTLEAQKRVSLLPFVSHRISLEEAPKFLEAMHQKTIAYTKVIIEP